MSINKLSVEEIEDYIHDSIVRCRQCESWEWGYNSRVSHTHMRKTGNQLRYSEL